MIKVITIDREYGTGGAEIAAKLARQLGWKLWDQALTSEIAKQAGKSREEALHLIESVDRDRAAFIKKYFSKQWPDHHLFHIMLNSQIGDEAVIQNILHAISLVGEKPATAKAI